MSLWHQWNKKLLTLLVCLLIFFLRGKTHFTKKKGWPLLSSLPFSMLRSYHKSNWYSDDLLFRYLETSMAIMSTCLSVTAPSSAGIRKLSRRPRDLACRGRSGGGSARRPSGRRKQLTMSALALLSLWWTKSWTFTSWRWTRGCRWNILSLKWLQVLIL